MKLLYSLLISLLFYNPLSADIHHTDTITAVITFSLDADSCTDAMLSTPLPANTYYENVVYNYAASFDPLFISDGSNEYFNKYTYLTGSYSYEYENLQCETYLNGTREDELVTYNQILHWDFYYEDAVCILPEVWDSITQTCASPPSILAEGDYDSDGVPNKCDKDFALIEPTLYDSYDCDGDGDPNGTDLDDDNDQVLDKNDPDSNLYEDDSDTIISSCNGADSSILNYYPSTPTYLYNDYSYYGETISANCQNELLNPNVDSVIVGIDTDSSCETEYCWHHYLVNTCVFNASQYIPTDGNWIYWSNVSESECYSKVDGIDYVSAQYKYPDLTNCPNSSFCYLKLPDDADFDTNTENNDSSMLPPDLNSTSDDLAPLLQAQNTTNKHLDDLKDKTDLTNNKLDDLKKSSNDLLTNNKDIKSSLDQLTLDSSTSLQNQLKAIKGLDDIESGISNANNRLDDLADIALNSNNKLNSIASSNSGILDSLLDGLFSDTDPFADVDFEDDGFSSAEAGFKADIESSFDGFVYSNFLGFASYSYVIPSIYLNIMNHQFTVFDASFLASLPISDIRNLMLFIFAVGGFITVFRTV